MKREAGGDPMYFDEDIRWFLNDSRGELGESGFAPDPTSGGGRNPANNWPAIERLHRAQGAVHRWRRLNDVWCELDSGTATALRHRYKVTERERSEVVGLRATFSDLATLAWHMCDDKEDMRRRLSSGKRSDDPKVRALKTKAEKENRRIHASWLDARRDTSHRVSVHRRILGR